MCKIQGFILNALVVTVLSLVSTSAQTPQWIWSSSADSSNKDTNTVYFRKTFRTPPLLWNSKLTLSAEGNSEIYLNGVAIAKSTRWDNPIRTEITVRLNQGENVIAVRTRNSAGRGALLAQLNLGGTTNIVSDSTWLYSNREEPGWNRLAFNASSWNSTAILGPYGMPPWGDVLARPVATSPESLTVPKGFQVELLASATSEQGSWVCLEFDLRGRLLISPEGDQRPLLRFTFDHGAVSSIETISAPIHFAMGLLYAYDSLYANARGPQGSGLYRLTDANQNDQFDENEVRLLKSFQGSSEHGYHALRLGPDGKIYVLNGNGTKLPLGVSPNSPYRNYAQDLVSLNPDETTEVSRDSAVQCHVLRTDSDGREWELFAGGMRNAYAFDFAPNGDLFTFDSDMEWDWGTPWYRPTRILHLVSAGEYGWRDGTRIWPDYYEDSLPPVVNVGIGSPTGVRFGGKSQFPEPYRSALFTADWSYGRILAIHLQPRGASYTGDAESFLQGTPLNLTDLIFGPDGAMYFITGGRATQSGLYRVSFTNGPPILDASHLTQHLHTQTPAQQIRRRLERWHSHSQKGALESIWPFLNDADRFVRFAARIALESQEPDDWKERALKENQPLGALNALLAMARVGTSSDQAIILSSLEKFPLASLTEEEQLIKLRAIEVLLSRGHSRPTPSSAQKLVEDVESIAHKWPITRETARLLIYLNAPGVTTKTLDLLDQSPTQEEQFHYVSQLRNLRVGWTKPDRERFLRWWLTPRNRLQHPPELSRWFTDVGRSYVDGAWVDRYLREFRADAIATLSAEEKQQFNALINSPLQKAQLIPSTNREFVQAWTMVDLIPDLERAVGPRNLARGRQAFVDAQCITCHRFGNDGGSIGPELTGAASKYDRRSLLESILEPSKVIAEQYQNTTVSRRDGESVTGRLVQELADEVIVETDPTSGLREKVRRSEIESIAPAKLSPMPEGLVNSLARDEILDLLAYLATGAK